MGNFEFEIVAADEIRQNVKALQLLNEAVREFGGLLTLDVAYKQSDFGQGYFVEVRNLATTFLGTFFLSFSQQEIGRVMTLVLLGGEDIALWKDEMSDFLYKVAKLEDVDQFFYMGRKGFAKLFPELEECARVYRVILKPLH